jgi:L-iditol 2-dehydrogenase
MSIVIEPHQICQNKIEIMEILTHCRSLLDSFSRLRLSLASISVTQYGHSESLDPRHSRTVAKGYSTMRAAALSERGALTIRNVPKPIPGSRDMLLRTRSCGMCGSDLYKIRNRTVPAGTVLGHEIVATVETCPSAYLSHFPIASRVTVSNHIPCGHCPACLRGKISMCRHFQATHVDPGGFAEFIRVPATHIPDGVIHLPDGISDEAALMVEPLGCCLRALDRWAPKPSDGILVVGLGTVGILMGILLKWQRARPFGVDPLESRRAMAAEKGCAQVVSPGEIRTLGPVQGVVLTVCSPSTMEMAINAVEPGGWIGLFAGPHTDVLVPCGLQSIYRREIDLIPSYSTGPEHMRKALNLLVAGGIDVSELTSHDLPVEEINRAVEMAANHEGLKAIIRF